MTLLTIIASASLATAAVASEPLEVTAPGPEGPLAGTLIAPREGKPVVLIIPGSGPTDRDGNNAMGVAAASYRLLAETLATHGIGTLRIDKRGMFGSEAAIPNANDVTLAAYAQDVETWAKVAKSETGVECVWVLGHSEGGLVALEAALLPDNLCGIILVAAPGRPLGTVLREQLAANPANAIILDQADAAITRLEAGKRVNPTNLHPGLKPLFNREVQGFLVDLFARDPATMAGSVDLPMLIVAGGKDIQTPLADARALAQGQPGAQAVVIEDMNHVLKQVEGEGRAANLAAYSDPSLPVHPELVYAITWFLLNGELS